jgi:CheY-like chemotaxis protein
MLEDALRTARGAADLVGQLMIVARAEPPRERVPTDLRACLHDVVALSRRIFRGRIAISIILPDEPVFVLGDASELHQMLLNFCINARDALTDIDDASFAIELDTTGPAGEGEVVLRVRDNGGGMDEVTVRRLGEPFFTTKAPGDGTGLGLATAYAAIRDMGGAVECESTVGEGTEFLLRLPRAAAPVVLAHRTAPPGPERAVGRVLIVDDEPLVRRAFGRVLHRHGLTVEEASDGAEALARLERANGEYTAVILDLSMRGLRGERVIARVREVYPSLPIVVVSGFVQDAGALEGVSAVLSKPVSGADLVCTIDRVASGRDVASVEIALPALAAR